MGQCNLIGVVSINEGMVHTNSYVQICVQKLQHKVKP